MTLRFHRSGGDPALERAPRTQWQHERARGPILPMLREPRSWWHRIWPGRRG